MRDNTAVNALNATEKMIPAIYGEMMKQALERFQHSSDLLSAKYEELCRESEELKKRLLKKDEEIEQHARMAMLGETAAALAHEVRNPLGAMKLFLSMLREDLHGKPDSLNLIDQMEKSISALDNLVSNILHFSKTGSCVKAPLNVHSLVQEVVTMVVPTRESRVSISFHLEGNPFILGSEHSIRQVFYNVLLNALQAMRYKGALDISSRDDGERLVLTVRDSGPGIAESLQQKLFEPFVTSRPEGTGLGLAIVRKILDQHGATVSAHNHRDGGAVFEICFVRG